MPLKCAGTRIEPPPSLPMPPAEQQEAIAAASPPLEPLLALLTPSLSAEPTASLTAPQALAASVAADAGSGANLVLVHLGQAAGRVRKAWA